MLQNVTLKGDAAISTWCCVMQGTVSIDAVIEKNFASPIECYNARIRIDHSRCNIPATGISITLEQHISLVSELLFSTRQYQTTITLAENHDQGLAANDPTVYDKILPLDLRAIKYFVPQNKEKDGVLIPLSPEETYLLSQL
jgi:hypothetical protein